MDKAGLVLKEKAKKKSQPLRTNSFEKNFN